MRNWTEYFTPPQLSKKLVGAINQVRRPRTAVDICAGSGNLLVAVSERWPGVELTGNDRYRTRKPAKVSNWSSLDGREYARQKVAQGHAYDIVVANPPFGNDTRPAAQTTDETDTILNDPRIEVGMTAAASLLVGPRGVLATVLPETLVFGETHAPLRKWLARRFCCFSVERIPRGQFRNMDLGLVMLTASRAHSGSCAKEFEFSEPDAPPRFLACRGSLSSADFHAKGGLLVVHCAAGQVGEPITMRRVRRIDIGTREVGKLVPGDVLVSRVGRGAGRVTIFAGPHETPFSDCVFRLRGMSPRDHAELKRVSKSGELERGLRSRLRGLGAQYVTKRDLEQTVSMILT